MPSSLHVGMMSSSRSRAQRHTPVRLPHLLHYFTICAHSRCLRPLANSCTTSLSARILVACAHSRTPTSPHYHDCLDACLHLQASPKIPPHRRWEGVFDDGTGTARFRGGARLRAADERTVATSVAAGSGRQDPGGVASAGAGGARVPRTLSSNAPSCWSSA